MLEEIQIENLIYEIRGKQVMLDSDLAKLYGCKNGTKEINQAMKNNLEKFPERFAFRITEKEYNDLKSKILTSNLKGGSRKGHTVFTEQGIAMLATILKSKTAAQVSIRIMDAFVAMRKFINNNKNLFKRITTMEYKMLQYDDNFDKIFNALEPKKIEKQKIFFNGEIYDSYSLIIDLIKEANDRIIIIDNYIDKSILDMLVYKKENVSVELITSSHYLTKLDI
ncbi:MAG: ORF6N domain-containing protein, partial [Bacilli bacterium]|nr:ORF6N domain-containing protein [Bacilli bacterium]